MIKRSKIMLLSLCLIGLTTFKADAQQTPPPAAGAATASDAIHRDIKSLSQQEAQLRGQLKTYEDQIKPLYEQLNQVISQMKPLKNQINNINTQIHSIQSKIQGDLEKLKS